MKESTKEKLKKRRLRPFLRKNLRFTVICLLIAAFFFALSFNYRPLTEEDYEIHTGVIENVRIEQERVRHRGYMMFTLFEIDGEEFCSKESNNSTTFFEKAEQLEGSQLSVIVYTDIVETIISPWHSNKLQVKGIYDEHTTYINFEDFRVRHDSSMYLYLLFGTAVLLIGALVLKLRWNAELDSYANWRWLWARGKQHLSKKDLYDLWQCFKEMCIAIDQPKWEKVLQGRRGDLVFLRKKAERRDGKGARELFCYCIDTLETVLSEKNEQKLRDYLATVCDVLRGYGNLRFYLHKNRSIKTFQRAYGKQYFEPVKNLFPYFDYYQSRESKLNFLSDYEEEFKAEHPVRYYAWVGCAIALFVLPLLLISFVTMSLGDRVGPNVFNDLATVISFIGAMVMGVGSFNLMAIPMRQYLGHKVTVFCYGVGLLLMLPLVIAILI